MSKSSLKRGQASRHCAVAQAGKPRATAPWIQAALDLQINVPAALPLIRNASTIYWLLPSTLKTRTLYTYTATLHFSAPSYRNRNAGGEHVLQDIIGHVFARLR